MGCRELINRILGELRDWREKSPEAKQTPDEVYGRIARLLRDARRFEAPDELETRVRAIEALIATAGPVSEEFLPSLEALHARVTEANLQTRGTFQPGVNPRDRPPQPGGRSNRAPT